MRRWGREQQSRSSPRSLLSTLTPGVPGVKPDRIRAMSTGQKTCHVLYMKNANRYTPVLEVKVKELFYLSFEFPPRRQKEQTGCLFTFDK